MESNYGSPLPSGGSSAQAKEAVSLPAILLMVMAGLTFLYGLVSLLQPVNPEQMAQFEQMMDKPELAQMRGMIEFMTSTGGRLAVSLPYLLINALVFFGALKMKSLKSYGLAMTAGILSLIPCCGPCLCLGLPVGIWALVVLRKPEVRAAFT
ncbi:hypothetical protein [Pyxidicoccus xibeiensis]|uniref:hypothetical protein n=1 Tax=Pyxidicoccus xibeiensis TaxID=2906759 RepID=UPI0020A7C1FC|nr:hypothetical protein [Pyxidicoccus xibeiensis]MCP3138783.1 hypothetical protein [Pyxidicoccus xibeiensis]